MSAGDTVPPRTGNVQPNQYVTDTVQSPELSHEALEFWGERAYIKEAPLFVDQVTEVQANPGNRSNIIKAKPSTIVGHYGDVNRTRLEFTEAEGIADLSDFLSLVQSVAAQGHATEDEVMQKRAQRFLEGFSFIGEQEFNEACSGLAKAWVEYVSQGEDYVLNLFDYSPPDAHWVKSFNIVAEKVVGTFKQLTEGTTVQTRLKVKPEDWKEGEHAKLIVVDDWITTGNTMRNNITRASNEAKAQGKDSLTKQLEGQVIIARPDQVGVMVEGPRATYKTRSYYEAGKESTLYESPPSGAHSSVDVGFENTLQDMHMYLREHGIVSELPLLTFIDRQYNPEEPYTPRQAELLRDMGYQQRMFMDLTNKYTRQRQEMQSLIITPSADRTRQQALSEEMNLTETEMRVVSIQRAKDETEYKDLKR